MEAPGTTTRVAWQAPPLVHDDDTVPELLARRSRPALLSEQAEDVALLAGLKPLISRELPWDEATSRAEFFQQRGLCAHLRAPGGPRPRPTAQLLAGRDEGLVGEAAALLGRGLAASREHQKFGSLLGYPPCCVQTFCEQSGDDGQRMAQAAARTGVYGDPWLNVLDPHLFRMISWDPCSFGCPLSATYAGRLESLLRPHFRPFLQRTREVLSGTRLFLTRNVQLTLEGEAWDEDFLPRFIAPTARERESLAPLDPQDEADVARALRETRAAQKISAQRGILLLDGAPWAPGFLVRFRG
jgi:hypothetical protein